MLVAIVVLLRASTVTVLQGSRPLHTICGTANPNDKAHGDRNDVGADELEKDAVAAPDVGHDLVAGQLEERQHAPRPLDRVEVVLVHIALIVDRAQFFFGATARLAPGCHVLGTTTERATRLGP